jgi:hypothetical protein
VEKIRLDVADSDCLLLHEWVDEVDEVEAEVFGVLAATPLSLVDLLEVRAFISIIETFCLAYLAE